MVRQAAMIGWGCGGGWGWFGGLVVWGFGGLVDLEFGLGCFLSLPRVGGEGIYCF